jgi:hypothetical protein
MFEIDYNKCPKRFAQTMMDYIENGYEPGGFINAVLANDLFGAYGRYDNCPQESDELRKLIVFIYNHVPSSCWGSYKRVEDHILAKYNERLAETEQ